MCGRHYPKFTGPPKCVRVGGIFVASRVWAGKRSGNLFGFDIQEVTSEVRVENLDKAGDG